MHRPAVSVLAMPFSCRRHPIGSVWVGLHRHQTGNSLPTTLGDDARQPKPNWRPLLRSPPSYFSVAHLPSHFHHRTPQLTFSFGRFGASFTQRKCIELSWSLFMVGKEYFTLLGNNLLLWVYWLSIPLAFPWSFDTWILCHKDPAGSIGCLVHNLLPLCSYTFRSQFLSPRSYELFGILPQFRAFGFSSSIHCFSVRQRVGGGYRI
jgi:hypothetical protein